METPLITVRFLGSKPNKYLALPAGMISNSEKEMEVRFDADKLAEIPAKYIKALVTKDSLYELATDAARQDYACWFTSLGQAVEQTPVPAAPPPSASGKTPYTGDVIGPDGKPARSFIRFPELFSKTPDPLTQFEELV